MIKVAIGTALIVLALASWVKADEWQSQVSRVLDGDTFQLSRPLVKIRLCGVDTPEKGTRGGKAATNYTKALIEGKTVHCRTVGEGTPCDGRSRKKSYDRFVAQCFFDGSDIAMVLVKSGHACAWPKYSGRHYSKNAKCER